ncbi:MAG TPA: PEPxxWA-CTERM sorting domain-containing protein [Sphingomicrobium sp.]|nr:PEPxxWA-CTERM sorting domain-containing protein [Sphingomicrobium sp.]
MRKLVLSLVAATAMTAASAASATSFVGSTTGCFGTPCPIGTSPTSVTGTPVGGGTGGVLTFTSGTFNVTDSGGIAPIGSGLPPTDTLGFFSLLGGTGQSTFNTPFTLFVTFTLPAGTSGAGTFMSEITGSVTDGTAGGVDIDFDNTPHLFTSASGPFTLTVRDLSVTNGGLNTPITGTIRAVPEPATWGMMLLGFAGIGFAMRRRRQPAIAQVA